MSYFNDEPTQEDVDFIFNNKDSAATGAASPNDQFYAELAARRPEAWAAMKSEQPFNTRATYDTLAKDVTAQRTSALAEKLKTELLTNNTQDPKEIIASYQDKAKQPITMRQAFLEQQGLDSPDDLNIARQLLTDAITSRPTELVHKKEADGTVGVVNDGTPEGAIRAAEAENSYYESLSPSEKEKYRADAKRAAKAQLGFARSLFAYDLAWMSQAANDVTGKQSFLYGNAVEALAMHIVQNKDKKKAAQEVIDSVIKHSGLVAENDFNVANTLDLILNAVDDIDKGDTESLKYKLHNLMLNVFGVLDFVPDYVPKMNGAVKTANANHAVKILDKDLTNPLADIAAHDVDTGAKLAAAAIQDPTGKAAETLGTSKESLAINSMPGFEVDNARVRGFNSTDNLPVKNEPLDGKVKMALTTADEITPSTLYNFVDETKQLDELKTDAGLTGYKADISLGVMGKSDDGHLRYGAVYGKSDDTGFSSFEEATKAGEDLAQGVAKNPYDVEGVEVIGRVGNGNTWEKVTGNTKNITEYKVQLNLRQKMRWETDMVLGGDDVQPALFGTRYFQNIHATISSDYVEPLTAAHERAALLKSDILKVNEPFSKLNELKKRKVLNAIAAGGVEEKVFTDTELIARFGLDSDGIAAYRSERATWDTIYHIKNKIERDSKVSEGYLGVTVKDKSGKVTLETMAKPVDIAHYSDLKTALIADLNGVRAVGRREIDDAIQKGFQLYKSVEPTAIGSDAYRFMLTHSDNAGALPRRVLPYREGYYYKVNKGKYFIEKEFKRTVDGVPETYKKAIAIADSPGAAKAAVKAKLGESYKVDENIVNDHDFSTWSEINSPTTGYWYSKRNPQMPAYSLDKQGKLKIIAAEAEDPVVALDTAVKKVSTFVAWRDTIATYEKLHKNTYPELWVHQGQRSVYIGHSVADNTARVRAANAMFDHLTSLLGAASKTDAQWNNLMVSLDRLFSNHRYGRYTSKLFLDAGVKANPARLLTAGVYYTMVASAPFRQFLLNIMTPTIHLGLHPRVWGKSIMESYLVYAKLTGGHLPLRRIQVDNAFRSARPLIGDVNETTRQFVRTGKIETLDSNAQLHNEMLKMFTGGASSDTGAVLRETIKPLKKGFNYIKEQGVVKGELFNKIFTFVIAKNKLKEAHNGANIWTKANLEKISNEANRLSLDPTPLGAYAYQEGLVRPLTQFLGVMHQAMAMITPNIPGIVRGNRAFDGRKAAVLLGLLATWGSQGLPFSPDELIDGYLKEALVAKGIDLSVLDKGSLYALHQLLLKGAFGVAIAETMRVIAGQDEPVQSRFSEAISPVSGGTNPFVERLLTSEGTLLELLSGPSLSLVNNVADAAKSTRLLLYGYQPEELSVDKLTDIASTWGAIVPSLSKFMQASSAIKYEKIAGDYFTINKTGTTTQSNLGEQLSKAIWGVTPTGDQGYFDLLKGNKEMEESSQEDLKALKRIWVQVATDDALTEDEKFNKITAISTVLSDNQLYNNYILDKLRIDLVNDQELNSAVSKFIKNKLLDTPAKSLDSTRQELERFFLSHPIVPKETQDQLLELIRAQTVDAEEALKILEDNDGQTN